MLYLAVEIVHSVHPVFNYFKIALSIMILGHLY